MANLLSIDQGTTSTRAIVFDEEGNELGRAQIEFPQHFPEDGWVEHDPIDIWKTTCTVVQQSIASAGLSSTDIDGIGITNQRETVVVWDKNTGHPIYPAIVWQDRRTHAQCAELRAQGAEAVVQEKTGLLLDPYFSATKIAWILDNVPNARQRANDGEVIAGTIDTWLIWKLTGGNHLTDATNASRTLLFNIQSQQWDEDLLVLFRVPPTLLPQVLDCAAEFGTTSADLFGAEIPILGVAGDQQAALIGQAGFEVGALKSTYGTGCFVIANTGSEIKRSDHRLLSTVAYRLNGETTYGLEGSIFMAGASVQWLRDQLHLIDEAAQTERLFNRTNIDHGVVLVPAFVGLGAPYWDSEARAALYGMTRDTGIGEIVSATLQSIAFQTLDLIDAMKSDGLDVQSIKVDGGMVGNTAFMQHLADITRSKVQQPTCLETTALGVAYLAGLKLGVFKSLQDIEDRWQRERRYHPQLDTSISDKLYSRWKRCVDATLGLSL